MKIISKFKDYYDSAAIFHDHSILLKREEKKIPFPDLAEKGVSLHFKSKKITHSRSNSIHSRSAAVDFLYFCGKVYPIFSTFYETSQYSNENGKPELIIKREDEVFFKDFNTLIMETEKEGFIKKSPKDIKILEDEIKNSVNYELDPDIFRKLETPYFLSKGSYIITYPALKDLMKSSFRLDAFQAYQEIEMYISGVMGNKENQIITISDKDKRNSKGFDDKSFRKRKVEKTK